LLIHKLDTSKIEYNFTLLNLNEILQEIYKDSQILAIRKEITVQYNSQDRVQLRGNKDLIIRLLWNLIDNAIKYSHIRGTVKIDLKGNESEVLLVISDNGIGIPEADIDKIFDRFYRVDKSRSRNLGGSGLGLSICKWIMHLHKGEIIVDSELGKGSTFTIRFPYHKSSIQE